MRASTMMAAQRAFDNMAPPEVSEIDELIFDIECAEGYLGAARIELCKVRPRIELVNRLMADAANCLISE